MGDSIVVDGGTMEEIGNRYEGSGYSGNPSLCKALVFKPPLKDSGATTSPRSASQWVNC
jgi:hypothetical protein